MEGRDASLDLVAEKAHEPVRPEDVLAVDIALERLATIDPEQGPVVELRFLRPSTLVVVGDQRLRIIRRLLREEFRAKESRIDDRY